MSERLVEIPVTRETRNELKKIKGILTYEQLFKELLKDVSNKMKTNISS
jgi:hypothetical protein